MTTTQAKCKSIFCCLKSTERIEPDAKLCSICRTNQARHVRKIDVDKVPKEYMLGPNDISSFILTNTHQIDFNDRRHFLNLPREHRLTKYDYYLCDRCYDRRITSQDQVWNYWSDI